MDVVDHNVRVDTWGWRRCTKQVVRLQLHHMRGSSPSASQQMPCFLQPEQRDCCCTDTLPSSRLHIVPGPVNGPRPLQHASIMHRAPGYMNVAEQQL